MHHDNGPETMFRFLTYIALHHCITWRPHEDDLNTSPTPCVWADGGGSCTAKAGVPTPWSSLRTCSGPRYDISTEEGFERLRKILR